MPTHLWIFIGSFFGGTAVILGAFGAHYLKQRLDVSSLAAFETAVRYQLYHALVLLFIGVLRLFLDKLQLNLAACFFVSGTFFFSGSLYLITLGDIKYVGLLTPFGGGLLVIAWFLLAKAAL